MDDVTAELLQAAWSSTDGASDLATTFHALTSRNTRGPSMHRIDRAALRVGGQVVFISAYVPVQAPAGVVILLDRSQNEGGHGWATESLARRIAERTSCEVVAIDPPLDLSIAHDAEEATRQAAALVRWCVERRESEPTQTTSIVVLGHGAGALSAAHLMSQDHFESVGAFVTAWILVSPAFGRTAAELDPAVGSTDQQYVEMVKSRLAETPPVDVLALADQAAALTAPVVAHVGGELDYTASGAKRFVAALSAAGVDARLHDYPDQIDGFFSVMSIPTGERTLQSVIRTVRSSVITAPRGDAENE